MHETTGIQAEPAEPRVEDIVPPEILADPLVDRAHLEEVLAAPEKFLPEPAAAPTVPEPGTERPPQEPESRFARRSKLLGLLGAAALLTGSIAAAAMLRDRPPAQPGAGTPQPAESAITGAAALGAFAIPAPRDHSTATGPTLPATSGTTAAGPSASSPTGVPVAQVAPVSVAPAAGTSAPAPAGKRELVERFYRQVDLNPSGALAMLTGTLAGSRSGDLVRAWSTMDSVRVESVREQPDGSVLAVVSMYDDDGHRLRITQQLWFGGDDHGLISQARLLSAQHTS